MSTLNQRAVDSTPTRPTIFLNDFRIFLLDFVNLVPTPGANVFKLRVQQVHEPLLPARQPLGVVVQRRGRFGMAELFRDVKQWNVRV